MYDQTLPGLFTPIPRSDNSRAGVGVYGVHNWNPPGNDWVLRFKMYGICSASVGNSDKFDFCFPANI